MQGAKVIFLFPTFLLLGNIASSQTENKNIMMGGTMLYTERDSLGPVYNWVEQMPETEGGMKVLQEFIAHRPYPQCGLDANIEGVVVLQFIVEKDGSISGTKIVRNPDECLSKAALDYFNKVPSWKPGKYNGEIVACYFTLPIKYYIKRG